MFADGYEYIDIRKKKILFYINSMLFHRIFCYILLVNTTRFQ